jgi:uncharacterized protein YbgA (DUF1722 family)/uncharacterized protein YbbK (DUF523 family)
MNLDPIGAMIMTNDSPHRPGTAIVAPPPPVRIRIGVSSCLLGQLVRYDGQHKRDQLVSDVLAPEVELVAVCPELEAGFGVPREPVHLVRRGEDTRMIGARSARDQTDEMNGWAERRVDQLAHAGLSGYILKKDSPSCGMTRVKRFPDRAGASPVRDGTGLFAAILARRLPNLPLEEEGRLYDVVLRDTFLESVFAYHRWQTLRAQLESPGAGVGALVTFHTGHKLSLLAHVPAAYQSLGRIVAEARQLPRDQLLARYESGFMAALRHPATRGRHTNVLQHMAGYFKKTLDDPARRELESLIADYSSGLVPLVAPLTLLRHHVHRLGVAYLAGQRYLDPPPELRAIETRLAQRARS